jgi:hypothetical protein
LRAFGLIGALALVAFFLVPSPHGVTLKGGSEFDIFVQGPAEPRLLADGATIHAGDVLRFQYSAKKNGYLMVVDWDGTGQLTVFHPFGLEVADSVQAGPHQLLPESVKVDAAKGPERVVAIFSPEPFSLSQVRAWLDPATGKLACPDCESTWVVLEKP